MNEAELAAAIRDDLAPSPSRFGASSYFALRISGTGIADRPALEEVCYRCPDVWTSPEMLARCAGLPVIFGHPAAGKLDSEEYAARNVGSIVLPYVDGSECWGVARICDDAAAAVMASGGASTSPMVTLGPDAVVISGSQNKLVIEGDPATLDHVAVCPLGVWDKGGPPSGIRIDNPTQEKKTMTEEEKKEVESKKPDSESQEDDPMKEIMALLGGIGDAITSLGKRLDTIEDDRKKEEARADAELIRTRGAGHRADSAAAKEEAELATEQSRADVLEQAWGRSAPRYLPNETPKGYLIRSLHPHKEFSPHWKDFDLSVLPLEAVRVAAEQIRADSMVASRTPIVQPGRLESRVRRTDTGHVVTEHFGSVHDFDAPFRSMPRFADFNPRFLGGQG